ncbi:MAG: amidohydrolase family protein, partial [candidate division FCPU426 bacterium]
LSFAAQIASKFPGLRFVLDHLAKPLIASGELSQWQDGILALAAHENVCCKVSGMVTEANWTAWKTEDFKAYLDVVFEAFGPQRLLFGSDWPVCGLAADYRQVYGITDGYVRAFHPTAFQSIFRDNARSVYRLT